MKKKKKKIRRLNLPSDLITEKFIDDFNLFIK